MTATLAGSRRLYVVAGLSALLAMLAIVVDIVLGFGGEMVTYGAKPAAEWFDVFQRSPFEGLYALGILNNVYMLGMLPVFVAMVVVHRHTYPVSAGFALLLSARARGEDFMPGTSVGLFLSGLAAIVVSIVMLRGRVFSRIKRVGGDRLLVPHAVHVRRHIHPGVVRGGALLVRRRRRSAGAGVVRHDWAPISGAGGVMPVHAELKGLGVA